ncbi:SGNH/GDSL hydrolase family protein [Streptomyces griseoloalbus]|uniref:SGNH/GDSL hydrolase family protein n=1 Tax=Streptomyces griseoloalbus TaxID=67303 RepID=UPI0033BB6BB3
MRHLRPITFLGSLLLAVVAALTGTAAAQAAEQAARGPYVALGDSYSSGVGAGNYISSSGDCKRSTNAYPYLWAGLNSPSSFSFTACSGARTGDVVAGQLSPLNSGTSLVSISVGGNDAGFADVMTTCVTSSDSTCLDRINTARAYVSSTLPGKLDTVYSAIRSKAPNARVAVFGYPRFYKLGSVCIGLSETKRKAINDAADLLNSVISQRAGAYGYVFADVRGMFTGHEICSGNSWLHSVDWTNIGNSYHPKAVGHSSGYLPVLSSVD